MDVGDLVEGFDWKSVVKTVAPILGTAIGGPFGGMAAKVASMALLGKEDGSEDELALAVQNASPADFAALKKADQGFKATMRELDIKEDQLVFADKDSARKRQVATGDITPQVLAYLVTALFAVALGLLFFVEIPEGNKATIYLMMGTLGTLTVAAFAYFHGSSRGSDKKDVMLKG